MIEKYEVERWYDYYLKDIILLHTAGMDLSFKSVNELSYYMQEFAGSQWLDDPAKDSYIATNDRNFLANHVLTHGMFFPFIIDKSTNKVIEGQHRLEALKSVNSDKKFLCWASDFLISPQNQIKSIDIYVPVIGVWDYFEPDTLKQFWNSSRIKILDEDPDICIVTIDTLNDLHFLITKFGIEFGKLTTKLKRQRNIDFNGSPLVNDQKYFEENILC